MGKMGKTVSVLAVTLVTGSSMGCGGGWLDREPVEEPQTPSSGPDFGDPIDGGFAVPRDGGRPNVVPARLSSLIVADKPPPAISGGTLAVTEAGDLAVAADSDRDAIYVIALPSGKLSTIAVSEGSEPGRVLLDSAGNAHVALRNTGMLVHVDVEAGTKLAETAVCQLPRGLAYDKSKDQVLVTCASGELVVLAASTHAEVSRTFIDLDLRDIVLGKDGTRFVSRYRSAELLQLSADNKVLQQTGPRPTRSQRFEEVSSGSNGAMVNIGPREVTSSPTLAWKTVAANDGSSIMLHQQSQDDEVIISSAGGYGGGCQPITQGGITRYDANGQPSIPVLLGGAALAVDVASSGDGKWIAVAKPGAYLRGEQGSVEVISAQLLGTTSVDADAGVPATDGGVTLGVPGFAFDGGGPVPSNFFPNTCITGSQQGMNVQATAVVFDARGNLIVFSREPAQLIVYELQDNGFGGLVDMRETNVVNLSTSSVRDTGHELFHADVGTGLACASCHGEALDDGHVWNFRDFGPRRTQNMRGGLLSTLPLHWEGDMPEFKSLVDEVMTRRMGGFTVEPRYSEALAQWLDKQPAISLKASDEAAALRGKQLFESAEVACSSCHSGPKLTNNTTVDVGTGGLFQVPPLLGVALHAPFMHDGCAATMTDRFDAACGGGDKHGKTSQLSKAQIQDLVTYLETL